MLSDEEALRIDRADLLAILQQRFGSIPEDVRQQIERLDDLDTMNRLILVAVNASKFEIFVNELKEGKDAFRIVGEQFNPLAKDPEGK